MRLLPFDHAIRNLGRSPRRLALVVGGSALVSLLVLGAVAFSRGLEASLGASGLATNALLLGAGSEESVERSEIPPETADALAASVDGLAIHAGRAAVASEIHVALPASLEPRAPDLRDANAVDVRTEGAMEEDRVEDRAEDRVEVSDRAQPVLVRGFDAASFVVHPQVRLAEGRWPDAGTSEIAAGPEALARVPGATLGSRVVIASEPFEIVGILAAPGTTMHGEFWMRVDRLALLTQRSTRSCVVAALGSAELEDVEAFTTMRLDLEAVSMRESAYYERLAEFLAPIRALVIATAILVSIGGALGGVNAMYAAFASRVREAGTLQALGFSRLAIAVSLLVESMVACAAGALLACAIGRLLLDGVAVRFSMGSFGLSVDAAAIAAGLVAGLLLGLLGAIAPIVRCLALPIPVALRS